MPRPDLGWPCLSGFASTYLSKRQRSNNIN
jgi:hypothetical protein